MNRAIVLSIARFSISQLSTAGLAALAGLFSIGMERLSFSGTGTGNPRLDFSVA